MSQASLFINLKRADRKYVPGDKVAGIVVIDTPKMMSHNGIKMKIIGSINPVTVKGRSIWTTLQRPLPKPIIFFEFALDIATAGKLPSDRTELPFEFRLVDAGAGGNNNAASAADSSAAAKLIETYRGKNLEIRYYISVEMARGFLNKPLEDQLEIFVRVPGQAFPPPSAAASVAANAASGSPNQSALQSKSSKNLLRAESQRSMHHQQISVPPKVLDATMLPTKIADEAKRFLKGGEMPPYRIDVHLDSTECDVRKPLTGYVSVRESQQDIRAINVQFLRIEAYTAEDGAHAEEASLIQILEIASGNVCPDLQIPINMDFPKNFSGALLATKFYEVQYALNVAVLFTNGCEVIEHIKLHPYRPL